jgi:hypothetical protein
MPSMKNTCSTLILSRAGQLLAACLMGLSTAAHAWGDEGHEIVGNVAAHFLKPAVRSRVFALLAADADPLTAHDFASEATWADKFRDSDRSTTQVHYLQTHQWHFVDIELTQPNIDAACFQHPALPPGKPAESGAPADCVVDKIKQFAAQLAAPGSSPAEKLTALKFLLHFVGDLHQPLHASNDHDSGGNGKLVSATGLGSGKLHGFWDTQFVQKLGADPATVAQSLVKAITPAQAQQWLKGSATDWAQETFQVAKTQAYGKLPKPSPTGTYILPTTYVTASTKIAAGQLSKAGVRLAQVLNAALSAP